MGLTMSYFTGYQPKKFNMISLGIPNLTPYMTKIGGNKGDSESKVLQQFKNIYEKNNVLGVLVSCRSN